MIKTILWDLDGTLLDFDAAEKAAMKTLFNEFSIGKCTDDMIKEYSEINIRYWQRLERREISKEEVLVGRFREFFRFYGIDETISERFNERYQLTLGDTIVFRDDSYELIKALRGRIRQFLVTNGTAAAQTKKLDRSGLGKLIDGVFISEEVGFDKPDVRFFEHVFEKTGLSDKNEILIVGDSLTSDITGGINAGIRTCWYNPFGSVNATDLKCDYEIRDLHEILSILKE